MSSLLVNVKGGGGRLLLQAPVLFSTDRPFIFSKSDRRAARLELLYYANVLVGRFGWPGA